MERLDLQGALRFIEDNSATLDQQDNLYASSPFLRLFAEHFPARSYLAQKLGDAVILLQGDGTPLANYYVERAFTAATVSEDIADVTRAFFGQANTPVIRLQPLSDTSACQGLSGWYAREYDCHENWYLPVTGTFTQYLADRQSSQWVRKLKKFSGTLALENDERGIAAYQEVYARSWKKPEPGTDFVANFMRMCAREGWLRLGIARVDGRPVAAQFWIVRGDFAYMYKIAYDEVYKKLSAGTCLTMTLMKHVLDVDQVREVDFGIGGDAYKKEWMTHVRRRKGVVMCRLSSPVGIARAALEAAGAARQRLLRKGSPTESPSP